MSALREEIKKFIRAELPKKNPSFFANTSNLPVFTAQCENAFPSQAVSISLIPHNDNSIDGSISVDEETVSFIINKPYIPN